MQDVERTILSQYSPGPIVRQMIANMNDCIDPSADIDAFYDLVMNVDTAEGYGLDVWGRIVGVSRVLNVPGTDNFLGFAQAVGTGIEAFGFGVFYNGESLTANFELSDPAFLVLILAKALANICDGSIIATNQILLNLFPGRGDCYVVSNYDMTMAYTFTFALTPVEAAIIAQEGILPTPTGVVPSVVQI